MTHRHRHCACDKPECVLCQVFRNDATYLGGHAKQRSKMPSLFRRGVNFICAVVIQALAGFPGTSADKANRRKSLCVACQHYDNGTCRHRRCGCVLATKINWETSRCPIGKW